MKYIKEKLNKSMLPILVGIFTFYGFGTVELYISNKSEFWFSYSDLLPILIVFAALTFLISLVVVLIIPYKCLNYVVSILYGMALLLYIQGNFLPNNYGQLDGTVIDWSLYYGNIIINIIIWCVLVFCLVLLVWKFKDKALYYYKVLFGIIIATQIVTLVTICITDISTKANDSILTTEGEFEISKNSNTFVFILDAFDAGLFYELWEKYPSKLEEEFVDFTFYRDTVGGATRTKYAIPYILSGKAKIENNSYVDYLIESMNESVLIEELRKEQYDARFYGESVYIDMNQTDAFDNIENTQVIPTSNIGLTKDFLKLTAFRYMPDVMKKFFWLYSGDFEQWKGTSENSEVYVINDINFYETLCLDGLKCSIEKDVFRIYHLSGAHAPYTMDENCKKVSYKDGTIEKQALGSLKIVAEFIQQLKDIGVYNNATIFIMADHGDRNIGQNPLFMVKERGVYQEFRQSNVSLSYKDVPNMFVDALTKKTINIEKNYNCLKERYFYFGDYEDIIHEYVTYGQAYDIHSFELTGKNYSGYEKKSSYEYKLGEILSFAKEGTANGYCISGFSKNEGTHTWTDGQSASMRFNINETFDKLKLFIEYDTYLDSQLVIIYANGNKVAEYVAVGKEKKEFIILGEYIENGELELSFEFPDAISPKTLGYTPDARDLALAFKSIRISSSIDEFNEDTQITAYKYNLGTKLLFKKENSTANEYCVKGFSHNEDDFTWNNVSEVEMRFSITNNYENLLVNIEYARVYNSPQLVIIYANGKEVANYIAIEGEIKQFIIPKEYVEDKKLILNFEFPNAISPQELNKGTDTRDLALAFVSMSISSTSDEFNEDMQITAYKYNLGTELNFVKETPTANEYCVKGFSHNEDNFTWTNGNEAEMTFRISDDYENLLVNMEYARVYASPQSVIIYANGKEVVNYIATEGEIRQFIIPGEYVMDGQLNLKFELPNADSPSNRNGSTDTRLLSLAMKSLTITSVKEEN